MPSAVFETTIPAIIPLVSKWSIFHPRTGHEGSEGEQRYSSTLSLTSALVVGGWLTPRRGRFETRYPLYRRLGGPQGRSGRVRKTRLIGIRSPDRLARSESLYRLSYIGSPLIFYPPVNYCFRLTFWNPNCRRALNLRCTCNGKLGDSVIRVF
jgi:hypothetical protein